MSYYGVCFWIACDVIDLVGVKSKSRHSYQGELYVKFHISQTFASRLHKQPMISFINLILMIWFIQ